MKDIREILTYPEKEIELSERSMEIDARTQSAEQREITNALKQTIKANKIVALSAPAIGCKRRIFCINFEEEIKTFINPLIINAKGLELSKETCTSIPGKTYLVPRNNDIEVVYQRPMGKPEQRRLVGRAAFIFQHEMQHLDGLTIADIGLEIDDDFINASEDEQQEIIKEYIESLDIKKAELDKEIQEDEMLKQTNDAIDFLTSVAKGETVLEKS